MRVVRSPVGLVIAGVGVAGMIAGGVLLGVASAQYDNLHPQCTPVGSLLPLTCPGDASTQADSIRRFDAASIGDGVPRRAAASD
jgi:hypothetical protein